MRSREAAQQVGSQRRTGRSGRVRIPSGEPDPNLRTRHGTQNPEPGTPNPEPRTASYAGTCRSGIGDAENRRRQGAAMIRAQRADRLTRALSVAMPVLAYIWR